jgi:hypothetical protein
MKIIKFDPDNIDEKKEKTIKEIKNAKQYILITLENRNVSYFPCNISIFEGLAAMEMTKSMLFKELETDDA